MIAIYLLLGLIALILLIVIKKTLDLKKGRIQADAERTAMKITKLADPGTVSVLSIMPLVDYYANQPGS
ncbi:MAG: hypothetical protein R2860_13245 [Desulfobacterales bacterium]